MEVCSAEAGPSQRGPSIRLSGVSISRGGSDILTDIDLSLDDHRIAVIGMNGSGKSTLVRLLDALLLPSSGEVRVGGLLTSEAAGRIRRMIGFVFQNPENQIVMPVVADDLAFGCRNLKLSGPEISRRVDTVLSDLGITDLRDRESHTLSGGEKQLVALAAVLVMRPDVIIFDEPTTMLDLRNRRRLQRHIDQLEQRVIMVTHDLELAEHYPRVIMLHDGRVAYDGEPSEAVGRYRELCEACLP